MEKVDLHIHSCYSIDADLPVIGIIEAARAKRIEAIAIADHNVVGGTREAMALAPADIIIIPAVEFDCYFEGRNIHILGYNIDPEHPSIRQTVEHYHKLDLKNSMEMIKSINALGLEITYEEVRPYSDSDRISGEHIAEALLEHPFWSQHDMMKPYHPGGSRSEAPLLSFFFDYFAQGKPASVHYDYYDYLKIIEVIHASGGKAVLAHPGMYKLPLDRLPGRQCGLDGWETGSFYHSSDMVDMYEQEADRQGLLKTCGSDFHGKVKPDIEITAFESEAAELLTARCV